MCFEKLLRRVQKKTLGKALGKAASLPNVFLSTRQRMHLPSVFFCTRQSSFFAECFLFDTRQRRASLLSARKKNTRQTTWHWAKNRIPAVFRFGCSSLLFEALGNKEAQALAELHSSSASCCCAPVR
jgi:hypothetical protein